MTPRKYHTEDERRSASRAASARYRAANLDRLRAAQKDYDAGRKSQRAAYYRENRERVKSVQDRYRLNNLEEVRSKDRARSQHRSPEKVREWSTRYIGKKYGCPTDLISQWEYACLNGVCEICGKSAADNLNGRLHKDHSHTDPPTPRGCLCDLCNRGLGHFKDSPDLLTKATQYLLARDPRYSR